MHTGVLARMAGPRPARSSSPPTGSCRTARSAGRDDHLRLSAAAPTGAPSIARRPGPPSGGRSSSGIRKKAPSAFAWRGRSSTPRTSAIRFVGSERPRRDDAAGGRHTVTGAYLGSDGKTGDAVWGTRGPWMALTGTLEGETVTDRHLRPPEEPGPPDVVARARVRALRGQPVRSAGLRSEATPHPDTLPAGAAFTFRHRILVRTGRLTHDGLQQEHQRFLAGQSYR